MRKILLILIAISFITILNAQNSFGVVEYDYSKYWIEIMDELPWMSQEDKDRDRLTWGKNDGWTQKYNLHFSPEETIYTYGERENEYGYSWKQSNFILINDLQSKTTRDWVELLGKDYKINDDAPRYKWKILNEIKEVAGYICMKAETQDTLKDHVIHAWFATDIPVPGGPEGYYGLPGMILELNMNEGSVIITATKVNLEPTEEEGFTLPKKMKGKKISRVDFNQKISKYIDQCIEGRRNPYWRVRY